MGYNYRTRVRQLRIRSDLIYFHPASSSMTVDQQSILVFLMQSQNDYFELINNRESAILNPPIFVAAYPEV